MDLTPGDYALRHGGSCDSDVSSRDLYDDDRGAYTTLEKLLLKSRTLGSV